MKQPSLPAVCFVGIQLAALAYIAYSGPLIARRGAALAIELSGLAIGAWAVSTVSLRHLRISPDVAPDARLVQRGPYRWIRHPMYLAVLAATLAVVLDHFTGARGTIWTILLIDLLAKLGYEERLLRQRFPGYDGYCRKTKRLLLFVY